MSNIDRQNDPGNIDWELEERYREEIDTCKTLWGNTGNPVYIWQAISFCFSIGMVRERRLSGTLPAPECVSPCELPDWCLRYLGLVASRMLLLSDGKDFRSFVQPVGSEEPSHDAYRADLDRRPELSLPEAATLVAAALEITRNGSNAFDLKRSLDQKRLDYLSLLQLQHDGLKRQAALDTIADETDVGDTRTVERRMSDVKKAYAPQPAKPTR